MSIATGGENPRVVFQHIPTMDHSVSTEFENYILEWEYVLQPSASPKPFVTIALAIEQVPGVYDSSTTLKTCRTLARLREHPNTFAPNGNRLLVAEVRVPPGMRKDVMAISFAHGCENNLETEAFAGTTARIFTPKVWRVFPDGNRKLLQ